MCSCHSRQLAEQLGGVADGIAAYLADHLAQRDGFGMRSFYGEAFSLALLTQTGRLSSSLEDKLVEAHRRKDRTDPQYHWEFNHYGMVEAGRLSHPLVFKNTPCTNWTLLRSNVRIAVGIDAALGRREALTKLRAMQKRSGLILDDPGVKSFQYHCFSAAMIYEIYKKTGEDVFRDAFAHAVCFIRRFILPNGDTLYVGRGQQQSFGYASLIYALSAYVALTGDRSALGDLVRVTGFLVESREADGSLPLVIAGAKEPLPHPDTPHRVADYPGWYAYNNYFDYLPFAGLFLKKASNLLAAMRSVDPVFSAQECYRDVDFLKVVRGETVAVISRPGGYWTNDLPVPYVFSGGRARMPCYGGEQFGESIYSLQGIPLPVFGGISMRWRLKSFFLGDVLVIVSPVGVLLRRFEVGERRIEIRNTVLSLFRLRDRYLFLRDRPDIQSDYSLVATGTACSASGRLEAYEAARVGNIVLEFPA